MGRGRQYAPISPRMQENMGAVFVGDSRLRDDCHLGAPYLPSVLFMMNGSQPRLASVGVGVGVGVGTQVRTST